MAYDPLSRSTRTSKRMLLLVVALAFFIDLFHISLTDIPLGGLETRVDPGVLPLLIFVIVLYFSISFGIAIFDDVTNTPTPHVLKIYNEELLEPALCRAERCGKRNHRPARGARDRARAGSVDRAQYRLPGEECRSRPAFRGRPSSRSCAHPLEEEIRENLPPELLADIARILSEVTAPVSRITSGPRSAPICSSSMPGSTDSSLPCRRRSPWRPSFSISARSISPGSACSPSGAASCIRFVPYQLLRSSRSAMKTSFSVGCSGKSANFARRAAITLALFRRKKVLIFISSEGRDHRVCGSCAFAFGRSAPRRLLSGSRSSVNPRLFAMIVVARIDQRRLGQVGRAGWRRSRRAPPDGRRCWQLPAPALNSVSPQNSAGSSVRDSRQTWHMVWPGVSSTSSSTVLPTFTTSPAFSPISIPGDLAASRRDGPGAWRRSPRSRPGCRRYGRRAHGC